LAAISTTTSKPATAVAVAPKKKKSLGEIISYAGALQHNRQFNFEMTDA
jgi:hypothetical protein